jgi:hypothetical protein
MIRQLISVPTLAFLMLACAGGQEHTEDNSAEAQLTSDTVGPDEEEWTMLFDGSSTDHWIELGTDKFPENGWVIEDGALVLNEGGNIITKEQYADFDLRFEFNLTRGANSGIKYYVAELVNRQSGDTVMNGPEYQLIDDVDNPDIQEREDETVTTAALYLMYSPQNKQLKPAGTWNTGRIISKDGKVEHWLNDSMVVSYERGSDDYLDRRAKTKFQPYTDYGLVNEGHIMLTDHHDKVYFRNIRIRRWK